MFCIETKNLTHAFSGDEPVLKNINLQVPENSIYGFLGPNGAGKTTTLRLVLGLLRKQSGTVSIFNQPFEKNRIGILKNIGSLIESPSLYGHLTATENLEVLQKLYQCPKERIGEVLEVVGLAGTGKKKASKFSLGMKQRLSIAMALLHKPSLLILDEPTNGLDPNGIIEIRELLRELNRNQKITILISSHLLSEIERLVTHVGIINKGTMLYQGTLAELYIKQTMNSFIKIRTNNAEKTKVIIVSNGFTAVADTTEVMMPVVEEKRIADINRQLVNAGIDVYQVSTITNDLESVFIDIIKNLNN
jgi:ABC-type multidrug transport system ATPase subunit